MLINKKILKFVEEKVINRNRLLKVKEASFKKARTRKTKIIMREKPFGKFELFINEVLVTFFACGKIKKAPGTFTSMVSIVLWYVVERTIFLDISPVESMFIWLAIIFCLFFLGMFSIPIYLNNKGYAEQDHKSIVIDEVIGQLLTLCLVYPFVKDFYFHKESDLNNLIISAHILSAFLFFRFFDITKPGIIGYIDRNFKNPFGVMLDDFLSGLISAIISISIFFLFSELIYQV